VSHSSISQGAPASNSCTDRIGFEVDDAPELCRTSWRVWFSCGLRNSEVGHIHWVSNTPHMCLLFMEARCYTSFTQTHSPVTWQKLLSLRSRLLIFLFTDSFSATSPEAKPGRDVKLTPYLNLVSNE
jgi:hypothetical protein